LLTLVLISSFVREKDGPVLSCTGPIALADDAQFAVAACPRRGNQVVSLIDESLRDFRRSLRVTLASPTFALKLRDGVVDFGLRLVVKLVGADLAEQFNADCKRLV
jgi:hypothetical protein